MKTANKISVTVYDQRTIEVTPEYPVYFKNNEKYSQSYYKFEDETTYTIVVPNISCIYKQKNGFTTLANAYERFTQIESSEFITAMRQTFENIDGLVCELEAENDQDNLSDDEKHQQELEAREHEKYDNHRNH